LPGHPRGPLQTRAGGLSEDKFEWTKTNQNITDPSY
jgi:hypothetical protein